MTNETNDQRVSRWAWALCWLMFASTVLNYMDRQTVSLLREPISQAFGITSDRDFGWILAAFYLTYALFQVPAGFLVDRWDLRWSYALAVAWWSLAAIATAAGAHPGPLDRLPEPAWSRRVVQLALRTAVTARILPPSDRSLGNGIFNSGAAIGAVVTPTVVTLLTQAFGWRSSFTVIGSLGFVWVAVWLLLVQGEYRRLLSRPDRKPNPADDELESAPARTRLPTWVSLTFGLVLVLAAAEVFSAFWYGLTSIWLGIALAMFGPLVVAAAVPMKDLKGAAWASDLGEVVRNRRFWILVLVSISINICWHFLVNWIPTYLKMERGMNFGSGNLLSTIPFLAADGGNLLGGWLAQRIARRGRTAGSSRRVVMASAVPFIVAAGLGVGLASNIATAVILVSIMAAATAAFMANYFSFTQDVSIRHTGLVVGYLGAIGNLFVAGFQPFAGNVKDLTGSFTLVFVIAGLAPLIGLAALLWGWKDQEGSD